MKLDKINIFLKKILLFYVEFEKRGEKKESAPYRVFIRRCNRSSLEFGRLGSDLLSPFG